MSAPIVDFDRAKDPKIVEQAQQPIRMIRWVARAAAILVPALFIFV